MQGVDPRSSGHFTYTHAPALASRVTPLRCTNRSDVVAWLSASFGVERALPEAMVRPPSISVEELERMLGRQGSAPLVVPVESVVGAPQPQPLVDLGINGQSYRSPTKQLLHGAKIKPQARMLPKFKCGVCGRDDHGSEECLLSCLSPPALVHNDVADELMLLDVPALSGADAVEDFFMRTAGNDDDSPMQQDSTFNISAFEAAMPATTSPGPVTQFRAGAGTQVAMPPLDPPTAAASAHQPDLLRWVAALPPQGVEDTVAAWARLLSGHISDTQPPGGVSEAWMPAGGVRWVPTGEALAVLHQLSLMEVDLALLEKTQVSRAVAVLRAHPSPLIAKAAEHIADKWRTMAMNALQKATTVGARLP